MCRLGSSRTASSATTLVTDEVLHPIGKIQPLLIGLNLPDEVESSGPSGALRAGGLGWVMWDWHVAMSHAIPLEVFHGLVSERWNSADSTLVSGSAELELHATVG